MVLAYVVLRNASTGLRSHYSWFFAVCGKVCRQNTERQQGSNILLLLPPLCAMGRASRGSVVARVCAHV